MEDKFALQSSLLQTQHVQQQQQQQQQQRQQQQQHFAQRIVDHLAFNGDILDRWHQIGSAQGLSSDLEVATFLIQHYENTWDRARPTEFCLTCHGPLTMTCAKCQAVSSGSSGGNGEIHHQNSSNAFPPLFEPGENFTVEPITPKLNKEKKRHKKSKSKSAGPGGSKPPGNSIDNDEDLMSLYMKFAQSQATEVQRPASPSGNGKSTRLKSYLCVHCGKTVFKPSDFKKHVRTHTREKPYKCDRCPAAFSDASSACRHRRTHTGEKPYECKLCPSSFAQSSDLTKHMRVHSGERPWQCQFCDRTFADTSSFARHRRQHEKVQQKLEEQSQADGATSPR
ncbi:hypothetical protein ACOMHN_044367 [Nucella lapillus]